MENAYSFFELWMSSTALWSVSVGCLNPRISFVLKRGSMEEFVMIPGSLNGTVALVRTSLLFSLRYCQLVCVPVFVMRIYFLSFFIVIEPAAPVYVTTQASPGSSQTVLIPSESP